jgi:hypothetical protein
LHAKFTQYFEIKYLKVHAKCGKLKKEVEDLRAQPLTRVMSVDLGV